MPSKVVIITGASRGIGAACARYLLRHDCNVVLVARSQPLLEQIAAEFPAGRVRVVAGDATDPALGPRAVEVATSAWRRVDGLIVNHGVLDPIARIADADVEAWKRSFDINVFSAVAIIKAALPALRETKGNIVITSSGASVGAYSAWGAYGAGKAALNHLAMTLAVEESDITSISIRPGTVDTEMQRELREIHHNTMDKKDAEKFAGLKTSGGLLPPEKPGHVIAKLSIDAPKDLSGKFLNWSDESLAAFQD